MELNGTRRYAAVAVSVIVLLLMGGAASSASARTVTPYVYSGKTITGAGSTAGEFQLLEFIAFDTANQNLYTFEQGHGHQISRFDVEGNPVPFSALGGASSFLTGGSGCCFEQKAGIAVDNSAGSAGDFYLTEQDGPLKGWNRSGSVKPGFPFPIESPGNPTTGGACGVAVDPQGDVWASDANRSKLVEVDHQGQATGVEVSPGFEGVCGLAIDSQGNFYAAESGGGKLNKLDPSGQVLYPLDLEGRAAKGLAVDPATDHLFVSVSVSPFGSSTKILEYGPDSPEAINTIGLPDAGHSFSGIAGGRGLAVNGLDHSVYIGSYAGVVVFSAQPPVTVPTVTSGVAIPTPKTALLRGTVDPDGIDTTDCHFEWGANPENEQGEYEHSIPCTEGNALSGSGPLPVTATISGLVRGSSYHFRLSSKNANGYVERGKDKTLTAQGMPKLANEYVTDVNTDSALVHAQVNPESGPTESFVEFGKDTTYGLTGPTPAFPLPNPEEEREVLLSVTGLEPGTEYHYRVVAVNAAGETTSSSDHTLKTFPFVKVIDDKCDNALSRQQTGAALLLNCRAYELVSAGDSGGYNIESDLIPGQEPFAGFPLVDGKVLYGVHNGGIPGSGNPTNHGVDPYVATRSDHGWSTRYVGVPANGTPSHAPFASTLIGASRNLDAFAFGGADICSPCFEDGSSGIPVRRPDDALAQGMAGSQSPTGATPDGLIAEPLSEDGSHLVFGSLKRFELDGNNETGDVSLYDRDLDTGVTQVISKTPAGGPLTCLQGAGTCHSPGDTDGIAELDMTPDGSRIVVAQRVSTDADGNQYWHPYLHIGGSSNTVDLSPGTTSGVLFDGMTEDGTKVFFTTRDELAGGDSDSSADIYEADVSGTGPATLKLISTDGGSASNSDSCAPIQDWNTVSGGPNCDAVALAGGAGVAAENGTFYFVSPEQLDGSEGLADQANLYVVRPGANPDFVTTIDSSLGKPAPPPPSHPVTDPELITALAGPENLELNQNSGDIYIKERNGSTIARFTSAGAPHNFTAGPNAGTNRITGEGLGFNSESQIAVDGHAGSPFENDFYVASNGGVSVFAESGLKLGSIGGFGFACGVAVDQSSGVLYVGDYNEKLWRLQPISGTTPVGDANYTKTELPIEMNGCQMAADTKGNVYSSGYPNGAARRFRASEFGLGFLPGETFEGEVVATTATTLTVDPSTDLLYIDVGGRIDIYDETGTLVQSIVKGEIAGSRGVAVNASTHVAYAVNGESIVEIGYEPHPFDPIDNPAVVHGVHQAGVHTSSDFQVTPDGHYAAFPSAVRITAFDSTNHLEIYRYDAEGGGLACPSCTPSNARATGDASLAEHGLSLLEDGRVFFTSTEPLVLRDTDAVKDVYEWEDGFPQLISTGASRFDSGLLSVTADGRDAYFFTREVLTPEDANGSLMKIYDAREGGGFFRVAEAPPCAASDECHGPGTNPAALPNNASKTGTPGNAHTETGKRCKKGFVKKGKRCVKARHHRKGKRRHGDRNG